MNKWKYAEKIRYLQHCNTVSSIKNKEKNLEMFTVEVRNKKIKNKFPISNYVVSQIF